jgi:hypothetical protein
VPGMAATVAPPRKVDSGELPLPLAAALIALVAAAVAATVDLVMLAMVMVGSGRQGVSVGAHPAPAALAGAGFACADTAVVLVLWRRGRLHPLALVCVWLLALLVAAPDAGAAGAAGAVLGGALAIGFGSRPGRGRASWRVLACLAAGACACSAAAAAIAPGRLVHRPPPAVGPAFSAPAADLAPAPAATPSPVATPSAARHATPTPPVPTPAPTPTPSSPSATPAPTSPAATPAPDDPGAAVAPAAPSASAAAAGLVRDYYTALDAHRFAQAWRQLAPAVQQRFGGFAAWRAGFRTTLSSRPQEIRVTEAAGAMVVQLTLVATDRTRCGPATRRFAVRWQLAAAGTGWRATSLTATALDKTASCG